MHILSNARCLVLNSMFIGQYKVKRVIDVRLVGRIFHVSLGCLAGTVLAGAGLVGAGLVGLVGLVLGGRVLGGLVGGIRLQ